MDHTTVARSLFLEFLLNYIFSITYHDYNLCLWLFFLYSFHDFDYAFSNLFCTVAMIIRSAEKYYYLNKSQLIYFRLNKSYTESRQNCGNCLSILINTKHGKLQVSTMELCFENRISQLLSRVSPKSLHFFV